jgi:anaerobic sulfite reductase subunit B
MTVARPRRYRVATTRRETHDTVTLTLDAVEEPLSPPAAGQFTMLTVFGVGEVPISVSAADNAQIKADHDGGTTLVQTLRAVGAVTKALHDAKPGAAVGVRGPFGAGWDLAAARGRDVLIIAGGLGLAPLHPVLRAVLARRELYGQVSVLVGARTPADILYVEELEQIFDAYVAVTVDHPDAGWDGRVGVVTTLLPGAPFNPDQAIAYVCGPELMMRFTADALVRGGVGAERVQLSLERNMRCGVGLCGHCQLGPLIVCRDGPVVTYDQVAPLLTVREL